jgi:hypothetical protein
MNLSLEYLYYTYYLSNLKNNYYSGWIKIFIEVELNCYHNFN